MMAPRRVVVALHAERWLQPKRESRAAADDLVALEAYVDAPAPQATLVFVAAGLNEQRRASKRLLAGATVVRCEGVATVADAQRWVLARLRESGKEVEPAAARALASMVGPDIGRLRREVDRILLLRRRSAGGDPGRRHGARRTAGGPRRLGGDARHRARGPRTWHSARVGLALEGGAVPQMLLGKLAWVARSKVPPIRVRAAIDAVFRTDTDLKRSAGEPRLLIERLVVELCGVGSDSALRNDARRAQGATEGRSAEPNGAKMATRRLLRRAL